MTLTPQRGGPPQPSGTNRTLVMSLLQTWADQRHILSRYPSPKEWVHDSEPLRAIRDPTFAHSKAVRVPLGAATTRKKGEEG